VVAHRIIASVVLALVVVVGLWLSGKFVRESAARVQEIRATERSATAARADVAEQRAALEAPGATYERMLEDAAKELELPVPPLAEVLAPHAYALELDTATVLGTGKSWSSPHLRVTAVSEKVMYQQHGASVSANHAIARIENISTTPVAYSVRVTSAERGRCEVRGSRMHNATALRPGERADVVVCAGGGAIRLDRVEVLELGELGHRFVSRVPPRALGADEVTANAHRPMPAVEACTGIDAASIVQMMRDGAAAWADVVDFYARHDCRRYAFVPGYRRATAALPSLPVTPAGAPP
jgi:hypothetical protein